MVKFSTYVERVCAWNKKSLSFTVSPVYTWRKRTSVSFLEITLGVPSFVKISKLKLIVFKKRYKQVLIKSYRFLYILNNHTIRLQNLFTLHANFILLLYLLCLTQCETREEATCVTAPVDFCFVYLAQVSNSAAPSLELVQFCTCHFISCSYWLAHVLGSFHTGNKVGTTVEVRPNDYVNLNFE